MIIRYSISDHWTNDKFENERLYTFVGHFATTNVSASCAASVFDVTPDKIQKSTFRNDF
jgi:hypothetical protein